MTTLFNTTELVPHGRRDYDAPDIEGMLKDFSNNIYSDLKNITTDETDFEYHTRSLDGIANDIKGAFASNDIDAYVKYIEKLEDLAKALGSTLIHAARKLNNVRDVLENGDFDAERLVNSLGHTVDDMMSELSYHSPVLETELARRGWSAKSIQFLFDVMQCENVYIELIAEASDVDDMILGVKGRMVVSNQYVKFFDDQFNTLVFTELFGNVCIELQVKGQKTQQFRTNGMTDVFNDLTNPTEAEILTWEMVTNGDRFDISAWRDTFGVKRPRKHLDI